MNEGRICDRFARIKLSAAALGAAAMSFPFEPTSHQQAASGGLTGRAAPAPERGLDRVTKSVRQIRMDRLRHQRGAAALLGHSHRVGLCQYALISKDEGVGVDLIDYPDRQRAAFSGVQRCGSVWICPCCSARISEVRRGELNAMLAWARSCGLRPVMLTLTARHGRDDDLGELLERLKKAKQKLHRHRTWADLKGRIMGSVTATEVTHGQNGWHPHLHMILLVEADDEAEAVALAEGLLPPWLASLKGAGLDGTGAGFRAQGAAAAGAYVGKWGAAEELALQGTKKGRAGRTPAQLLAAAVDDGDDQAARLWQRFAAVFQGRRQLVWSRGLKKAVGIGDTSDEDAAKEDAKPVRRQISKIQPYQWKGGMIGPKGARHRRGLILNAAEEGGAEAVARVVAAGGEDPRLADAGPLIEDDDLGVQVSAEDMAAMPDDMGDEASPEGAQPVQRQRGSAEARGRSPHAASRARGGEPPAGRRRRLCG